MFVFHPHLLSLHVFVFVGDGLPAGWYPYTKSPDGDLPSISDGLLKCMSSMQIQWIAQMRELHADPMDLSLMHDLHGNPMDLSNA